MQLRVTLAEIRFSIFDQAFNSQHKYIQNKQVKLITGYSLLRAALLVLPASSVPTQRSLEQFVQLAHTALGNRRRVPSVQVAIHVPMQQRSQSYVPLGNTVTPLQPPVPHAQLGTCAKKEVPPLHQ